MIRRRLSRSRTPRSAAFAAVLLAGSGAVVLAAHADVSRGTDVQVSFQGKLTPRSLPRTGQAPIRVFVAAKIAPTSESVTPPPLRQISIEINRHGQFDSQGLPTCAYHKIQPSSTQRALRACRSALVGHGTFSSNVLQATEAPLSSEKKLYAFNGTYHGKPAILAHVYGASPIPTSYTIPFIRSKSKGEYGTKLTAMMPHLSPEWGYITGLSLNLGRTFGYSGARQSFISGSCPTPDGVHIVSFKFARATFTFSGPRLSFVLNRSCRARNQHLRAHG